MKMETNMPSREHLKRIPVWLPDQQRVVYFVTACTANRRRLFINAENVRIGIEGLQKAEERLEWKIWHACFMPDHVHLLMSPKSVRNQNLSRFIQRWKSSVTMTMRNRGVSEKIWQNEFFDRLLRSDEKMSEKWEYIRANPVRAGLCSNPKDYPFSGMLEEILQRL